MKISVDRKYVEAWRNISWKDVKDAFLYFLKNPELIALVIFLGFFIFFSDLESTVRDEL